MAETPIYNHHDIQRYLQHKMSGAEMHQFEKALMNDPFLADALEGFSTVDETVTRKHLDAIEGAITGDQQTAKVVALKVQKTQWWKVAAVTITIVTAGLLTYNATNHQNQTTGEKPVAAATRVPAEVVDSVPGVEKPLADVAVAPNRKNTARQKAAAAVGYSKPAPAKEEPLQPLQAAVAAPDTPVNSLRDQPALASNSSILKTTTTSDLQLNKAAMAGQQVLAGEESKLSAKKLELVRVMSKETLSEKQPDTGIVPATTAAAPGTRASRKVVNLQRQNAMEQKVENQSPVQEEDLSLAEVVVSTMLKRKRAIATIQVDSSVAAEPVAGWNNFQQYFNGQVDSLKGAGSMTFDEDVTVEFSLDSQGRPTDIRLLGTYESSVKENTTRILASGPQWRMRKKAKRVKVVIGF